MSQHWTPDSDVRCDSRRRRRPNDAPPPADTRLMLLCASALFGVAIAIVEALLP